MLSLTNSFSISLKFIKEHIFLFIIITIVLALNLTLIGNAHNILKIDIDSVHAESLVKNHNIYVEISSPNNTQDYTIENLAKNLANQKSINGYFVYDGDNLVRLSFASKDYYSFYYSAINNIAEKYLFLEISNEFPKEYLGNKPNANNEIMISSYLAQYITHLGIYNKQGLLKPSTQEELIGNQLTIANQDFTITGIYKLSNNFYSGDSLNSEELDYIGNNVFRFYVSKNFATSPLTKSLKTIILYDADIETLTHIFKDFKNVSIVTPYSKEFSSIQDFSDVLNKSSQIILPVSFILIASIFFIFSHFYFKKENSNIMTLRTLGATKKDLFKIYIWQSVLLSLISFLLCIFFIFLTNYIINNYLNQTITFTLIFIKNNFSTYFIVATTTFLINLSILIYNISKLYNNHLLVNNEQ